MRLFCDLLSINASLAGLWVWLQAVVLLLAFQAQAVHAMPAGWVKSKLGMALPVVQDVGDPRAFVVSGALANPVADVVPDIMPSSKDDPDPGSTAERGASPMGFGAGDKKLLVLGAEVFPTPKLDKQLIRAPPRMGVLAQDSRKSQ